MEYKDIMDYTREHGIQAAINLLLLCPDNYKDDFDTVMHELLDMEGKRMIAMMEWLQAAHKVMQSMNNEECYYSWTLTVPDEPTMDDFEEIAADEEMCAHVVARFNELFDHYKKWGIYAPDDDVVEFLKANNLNIKIVK